MGKKMRVLLVACLTLAIASATAVVATYALWSSDVTVSNHLQAGTLSAELSRTGWSRNELDETGRLTVTNSPTDAPPVSYPSTDEENIFGLTEAAKMAPGAWCEADMTLKNGGDVAFGFWVEIVLQEDADPALAAQLTVTVTHGTTATEPVPLSSGLSVGSAAQPVAEVNKGQSLPFTVRVTFEDDDNNNAARTKNVKFDLIIHAVQAV